MGWLSPIKKAVHTVGHAASHAAHAVAHAVSGAAKATASAASDAAKAAGDEASSVAGSIESAGVAAGNSVVSGADWAGAKFAEGAEKVEEGAVAAGKFFSTHACSIMIGTALGTAVAAMSTDGEEEATMAALAIAIKACESVGGIAEVQVAATTVSSLVVDAVYALPEMSQYESEKNTATSILKYSIVMAAKENATEIEVSGGQYLTGVFLTVLTGFICTGELPGGFKVWQGEGSNFDILNQ